MKKSSIKQDCGDSITQSYISISDEFTIYINVNKFTFIYQTKLYRC